MPAKSVKQQRFMGMVHAAQKGELKDPSPEVSQVAATMKPKDAKDFAKTKHEGLPEKVEEKKAHVAWAEKVALNPPVGPVADKAVVKPTAPATRPEINKSVANPKLPAAGPAVNKSMAGEPVPQPPHVGYQSTWKLPPGDPFANPPQQPQEQFTPLPSPNMPTPSPTQQLLEAPGHAVMNLFKRGSDNTEHIRWAKAAAGMPQPPKAPLSDERYHLMQTAPPAPTSPPLSKSVPAAAPPIPAPQAAGAGDMVKSPAAFLNQPIDVLPPVDQVLRDGADISTAAQSASNAMRPEPKTAESCDGPKKAPRYKSQAKVGKKMMPRPHDDRLKKLKSERTDLKKNEFFKESEVDLPQHMAFASKLSE